MTFSERTRPAAIWSGPEERVRTALRMITDGVTAGTQDIHGLAEDQIRAISDDQPAPIADAQPLSTRTHTGCASSPIL